MAAIFPGEMTKQTGKKGINTYLMLHYHIEFRWC